MNSSLKKIARNSLMLIIGQGGTQLLSLIRNAIIGHLLTPEDFGIAATFTITISAIEMASDMAVDKLLVQSTKGDNPLMQGAAHLFMLSRGVFGGAVIFFAAPYIALFFDLPDKMWIFYWLALIPFIRGFVHLDVKRYQRDMNFKPYVLSEFFPQLITCLATYPIIIYVGGFLAVALLILLQTTLLILISHLFAVRKYKVTTTKNYIREILVFGWPLLINGILMFFIFQGDKLIIGATFNKSILGIYSAAFMIAMMPAMLLIKALTSILLPYFSKKQDNLGESLLSYTISIEVTIILASLYALSFILFGGDFLFLVFGEQYKGQDILVAYMGIVWAIRLLRVPPTLLAIAAANTKISLVANIFRTLSLVGVLYVALHNYPIEFIAIICSIGEFVALLITLTLVKVKLKIILSPYIYRLLIFVVTLSVGFYFQSFLGSVDLIQKIIIFFFYSVFLCFLFFIYPAKLRFFFTKKR